MNLRNMTVTVLIGAVCIWSTPSRGGAPVSPTLGLTSDSPFYEVCSIVAVDLEVAAVSDLYAIAADITYDPTLLTFHDAADLQVYGSQGVNPVGLLATDKPAEGRLVLGMSYLGEGHRFDTVGPAANDQAVAENAAILTVGFQQPVQPTDAPIDSPTVAAEQLR